MADSVSDHHAWRPPAGEAPPVEVLAGYDDLQVVGRGGESVVYRARDPRLARDVAVKVLLLDDAESAARFAREIEITVGLGRQHPNIVTVLDTGTTRSGHPAIVMDYYDGGTLHDRLRAQGPFPEEEVVRIGLVLSDALAFAHGQGFLHRDVKPQNVLVLPTSWVLADFGIARLVDAEYTSSVEAFTYRHASPQILDGHPPTPADDIWSLGSTLYTLLEGRAPFASDDPDDDSALAYLRRVRTEEHRPFSGDVGPLAEVVGRCLAKDVERRWATVRDVHDALAGLRHGAWEPGRVPPSADATRRRAARSPGADDVGSAPADHPAPAPAPLDQTRLRQAADSRPGSGPVEDVEGVDRADGGPPRRRRGVLLVGVVAVLLGTVLGIAGAVLRDPGRAPGQAPGGVVEPTVVDPATGDGDGRDAPVSDFDPALAFRIEDLRERAGIISVGWTDPSDGVATFHIAQTSPDPGPVERFDAGQTEATFTLAQEPGRVCFVMVLHMPDGSLGRSDGRCVTLT